MEEAVIVPWGGGDRAGEWACLWAGMGRGPERTASTAGMGMQLLGDGEGEGQVSQKATSSSEYISVVKGAESSLANWGRGWAPSALHSSITPHMALWGTPGLAQAEVVRMGQKSLLFVLLVSAVPGLHSLKDVTMLQVSPSTVCPGCPRFLFVPWGCISCQLSL